MFLFPAFFMAGSSSSRPNSVTAVSPQSSLCLLWLLILIPLALAAFSFLLQWQDGFTNDPLLLDNLHEIFPGMEGPSSAGSSTAKSKGNSGCQDSPSFPYLKDWTFGSKSDLGPQICVTTTTSAGLEQTLPWIFYHKVIGVSNFFIFVEGKAAVPNVYKVLKTIPGVKVIRRTRELEEQQAKSWALNEGWLRSYLYKPCNSELFVRQSLNMEMAIVMAREAGMDWIVHIDTDELVHPAGTPNYSFKQLLSDVPDDVDNVILMNYESCVERDDIQEPFSEVSMFKKNYFHLPYEVFLRYSQEVSRGNPGYFLTYENGKSAARIQDHLRPDGAHAWKNYNKTAKEMEFLEAALLHYTYSEFSDLASRRNRCGCKPTLENLERCFFLDFDREAFIMASTATEEELRAWYRKRVVWADKKQNLRLLRSGFFTRIYNPMIIIQALRESGLFSSVIASAHRKVFENRNFSIPTRN